MANLVITSTADQIEITFNDCASVVGYKVASVKKTQIQYVSLNTTEQYVVFQCPCFSGYSLCYVAFSNSMIVDTINGAAPTSNSDLYTKLKAII